MNLLAEIRAMRSGGLTYPEIAKVIRHATTARMVIESEARLAHERGKWMSEQLEASAQVPADLIARSHADTVDAIEETRQELADEAQDLSDRLAVLEDIDRAKSCTGKRQHATKQAAQAAIDSLRHSGRSEGKLRTYRCKWGDHFHVGHSLGQTNRGVA